MNQQRLLVAALCFGLAVVLPSLGAQTPAVDERPWAEVVSKGAVSFSPPASLSVNIDKKTPTFGFQTGSSPIVVVQLPDFTAPYLMRLSSECKCFGFTKRVFVPVVTFLDREYHVTRTLGEEVFPVKEAGRRPLRVEADIMFSEANRQDKFAVIFTDAMKVGKQAGSLSSYTGAVQIYNYPFFRGMEGKVRLEIVTEKQPKK